MSVSGKRTCGSPHGARASIPSASAARYKWDQVRLLIISVPFQIRLQLSTGLNAFFNNTLLKRDVRSQKWAEQQQDRTHITTFPQAKQELIFVFRFCWEWTDVVWTKSTFTAPSYLNSECPMVFEQYVPPLSHSVYWLLLVWGLTEKVQLMTNKLLFICIIFHWIYRKMQYKNICGYLVLCLL